MNTIQLELWHIITLLLTFLGASAGVGKMLLSTHLKHFDERFDAIDKHAKDRFDALDKQAAEWHLLERDLMKLKADLPAQYVRREDYIRGQTTLEAKIDAVSYQLQNLQLKSAVKGET